MKILTTSTKMLGFEAYVAPTDFDRTAQPVDIYSVFRQYYKTNNTAKYIYSVTNTPTISEVGNGTSFRYGYEASGISYTQDILCKYVRLTVGISAGSTINTLTVDSTTNFPNSGIVCIVGGYLSDREYFTYTSKDTTHFYGNNKTFSYAHNINSPVKYCIEWVVGSTKRWVIVNNTNPNPQQCAVDDIANAEWLYCGDKINQVTTGNGSGGICKIKYIHIHKVDNITVYGYCDHYTNGQLTGKLNLSKNPACTSFGGYSGGYDYGLVFTGNTLLTGELDIPSNITYIGGGSFSNCKFTSVIFREGLQEIRGLAFSECNQVTSVTPFPNSLTLISSWAFRNFGKTTSTFSLNVTSSVIIGDAAFATSRYGNITSSNPNYVVENKILYDVTGGICKALHGDVSATEEIVFKTGVTHILTGCFHTNIRTGGFTIPSTVTEIHEAALASCYYITGHLTIPDTVTFLGMSAFHTCVGLSGVTIGTGLTSLATQVFYYFINATSNIVIPNNITSIGDSALGEYGRTGGGSPTLTLPNSTCSIGNYSFYNSSFSGTLNIPSGITSIANWAFSANKFTTITSSNTNYTASNNILYDVKTIGQVKVIASANYNTGTLAFRNDTTIINDGALYTARFTGDINIPSTVTSIGTYGCSSTQNNGNLILNGSPTMSHINNSNFSFLNAGYLVGLILPVNYSGDTRFGDISNNFSAITLYNSLLNITDGTVGSPKTFVIGATNKTRLLSSYPTAETDANARYINII